MPVTSRMKAPFHEDRAIGQKAKGLYFLEKNKFRVPSFYALDFLTLTEFLRSEDAFAKWFYEWKAENKISTDSLWAVRSSADVEDGKVKSFAGLFKSETNVATKNLKAAIYSVCKSYEAATQLNYDSAGTFKFGIILQQMVSADYSGVIFSHHPLNVGDDTVHINITPGLGEALVSGEEEAFLVTYKDTLFNYTEEDFIYKGRRYVNGFTEVVKSGKEIKVEISFCLEELVTGIKKLSSLLNYPVDAEFSISGNTLYWLQVRPITSGITEKISTWDNTGVEANYPGTTLPLTISLVNNSLYRAYTSMGAYLGMDVGTLSQNEELLKNMSGGINGGLYYNVTAWQQLVYQLPFGKKVSAALPKMWGIHEIQFEPNPFKIPRRIKIKLLFNLLIAFTRAKSIKKKYLADHASVMVDYKNSELQNKTYPELITAYYDIEKRFGHKWIAPVLNGFFTMMVLRLLRKSLSGTRLQSEHPNFINDVLSSSGDVVSVSIVRNAQELLSSIRQDPQLYSFFMDHEPEEIKKQLPARFSSFDEKLSRYIRDYGERCGDGELKMETVNYKEDPLLFISFLKSNAASNIIKRENNRPPGYNEVLKKYYKINFIKRITLQFLIKQAISKVKDRENYRFMRTQAFHVFRQVFRAMDNNLLRDGLIQNKNDSLYLVPDELTDLSKQHEFKILISARKDLYSGYEKINRPNRYSQTSKGFVPVETADVSVKGNELRGTGCCSGIVRAGVVIVQNGLPSTQNYSGKILIADFFDPGKLNLFSQAAGIISARGNLLSHTAILCREMGIPSIVGAKGILSKIKNGDIIEMNGGTGTIKILGDE